MHVNSQTKDFSVCDRQWVKSGLFNLRKYSHDAFEAYYDTTDYNNAEQTYTVCKTRNDDKEALKKFDISKKILPNQLRH